LRPECQLVNIAVHCGARRGRGRQLDADGPRPARCDRRRL